MGLLFANRSSTHTVRLIPKAETGSYLLGDNLSFGSYFQNVPIKALSRLAMPVGTEPMEQPLQNEAFQNLLTARLDYLEGLKKLMPGWISGTSEVPKAETLKLAKELLEQIGDFILQKKLWQAENKLLMSPIPSGGVSIELRFGPDRCLLLSFFNSGEFEAEYELDGQFGELNAEASALDRGLGELVQQLATN